MLLPAPPRQIPRALQAKMLLGSTLSLTGWFGLFAASFMIIAGVKSTDPYILQKDPVKMPRLQGQVVSIKPYKTSKNSGFYYSYDYSVQGKTYHGQLILRGSQIYFVKQNLQVAYLKDHPDQSVIPAHAPSGVERQAEFAVMLGMSILCGLFGLACIAMIILSAYDGWVDLKLLKNGVLEQAKILSLDASKAGVLSIDYRADAQGEPRNEVFSSQRVIHRLSHLKPDSDVPVLKFEKETRIVLSLLPDQDLKGKTLWLSYFLMPPLILSLILLLWLTFPN